MARVSGNVLRGVTRNTHRVLFHLRGRGDIHTLPALRPPQGSRRSLPFTLRRVPQAPAPPLPAEPAFGLT